MVVAPSTVESGLFHCNSCGRLFTAPLGEREERRCQLCGNSVLGAKASAPLSEESPPGAKGTPIENTPRGVKKRRAVRKRKADSSSSEKLAKRSTEDPQEAVTWVEKKKGARKSNQGKYLLFFAAWALVLGGVAYFYGSGVMDEGSVVQTESDLLEGEEKKRQAYALGQMNACYQVLEGYLLAGDDLERTKFIKEPSRVSPQLSRHFRQLNEKVVPALPLVFKDAHLIDVGETIAIESTWTDQDGVPLSAVFFRTRTGWLLDWEHFVRAGNRSFQSFLNNDPGEIGTFRVLMRERLPQSREERGSFSFSVYLPQVLGEQPTDTPAAEVTADLDVKGSELYRQAELLREEGQAPFDAWLPTLRPNSLMEVYARFRLVPSNREGKQLELIEFYQPHWLGTELTGLDEIESE